MPVKTKCYICDKLLDFDEIFVLSFTEQNESYDLCEQCYDRMIKYQERIEKRKEKLQGKICCKNYDTNCEYNGMWLCKNPDCKTPVITSTLPGAYPSGCPKIDKWNSKKEGAKK